MSREQCREVEVDKLPQCDFCYDPALYDGKTFRGYWAYMCQAHFDAIGVGLGLGKGQKLILREKKEKQSEEQEQ